MDDPEKPKIDPADREMESIIGHGHDLRAANTTLGENAHLDKLKRDGFELDEVGRRDSDQYNKVLDELAKEPLPIGTKKGAADRAIVADTLFGKGSGPPTLMTGDQDMIARLYSKFGPGKADPIKKKPQGWSDSQFIDSKYPNGFDVEIPDGAGGTRKMSVIPMVAPPAPKPKKS